MRVEGGGLRVEGGGWRVEGGGLRVEGFEDSGLRVWATLGGEIVAPYARRKHLSSSEIISSKRFWIITITARNFAFTSEIIVCSRFRGQILSGS